MHILHLYKDYAPVLGGIENHIRVLAEAQAAAGLEVTVAVCMPQHDPHLPAESIENGVRVLRFPRVLTLRSMPLSLPYALGVRRCIRSADVVHVHSPFPLGEALVRNLPPSIRLLATHHSDVVRQKILLRFYAPLYRTFLKRVDTLIPTSTAYAESSPWLHPWLSKCHSIPLGVDVRRFAPDPDSFPLPETPFRLLFVGRLRYYKGLDTLLRALSILPDSIELEIVGDGPMGPEWRSLSRSLGLSHRVHFRGEISDEELPQVYRQAALFVLPCNCRAEAFGTVLAEALASGVPCITCEVGSGTSTVVQHGKTGLVVPPSDAPSLAHAIRSLYDNRPLLHQMAQSARIDALARLSDERMVQQVLSSVLS